MLLRLLLVLLTSRLHPPFPSDFDLASLPHAPCRIFNRSAFSQEGCGACAAFAVSTAFAMRECVREGRDAIPSPHRLFDCGGGDCAHGSVLGAVVGALSKVGDVDDEVGEFGQPCRAKGSASGLTAFPTKQDDGLMLKAELYVFRNPVLAVIRPDEEMSLYPFEVQKNESEGGVWMQLVTGSWLFTRVRLPGDPLPVYHISGPSLNPHVVVVLGWGSTPEPHWVVQNSWGDDWGVRGRGKIAVGSRLVAAAVLDSWGWRYDWVGLALVITVLLVRLARGREAEVRYDMGGGACRWV